MKPLACAERLYKEALWTVGGVFDMKQPIVHALQRTFEEAVRVGLQPGTTANHVDALIAIMKAIKHWNHRQRGDVKPLNIAGWEPVMMECLRLCVFGHVEIEAEFNKHRDETAEAERQDLIAQSLRDNKNPSWAHVGDSKYTAKLLGGNDA